MNPRFAPVAQEIVDLWRGEFIKVMEAMADVRPELNVRPGDAEAAPADLLWWKQPFDLADGAILWVGVGEAAWTQLGQQILTAAGIESAAPQEARSTFLEVLRQSLGSLATALGPHAGREVAAKDGAEEEPGFGEMEEFRFSLRVGGVDLPEVHFSIARPMLEAMSRHAPEARQEAPPPPEHAEHTDVEAEEPVQQGNLDLLLDVEMPVSVSFGRTQLRLQDVLKLITGSIIELDRAISEPVQVIVNNCVIASGEVVVVDGNYGVRIQEITSRRERLQQSRRYMLPAHRSH